MSRFRKCVMCALAGSILVAACATESRQDMYQANLNASCERIGPRFVFTAVGASPSQHAAFGKDSTYRDFAMAWAQTRRWCFEPTHTEVVSEEEWSTRASFVADYEGIHNAVFTGIEAEVRDSAINVGDPLLLWALIPDAVVTIKSLYAVVCGEDDILQVHPYFLSGDGQKPLEEGYVMIQYGGQREWRKITGALAHVTHPRSAFQVVVIGFHDGRAYENPLADFPNLPGCRVEVPVDRKF